MYISFGSFMKKFGGVRMGVRVDKGTGCFYACLAGMGYMIYWMILLMGWLMYMICYLFFIWPIKAIVKAVKKRRQQ